MSSPESIKEPTVCVAFGIELGERARREGVIYDVNQQVLEEALLAGGLSREEIIDYPTIIKGTDDALTRAAAFFPRSDGAQETNDNQTHIELYTFHGRTKISAKAATHEARHIADRMHMGDKAIVSERARRVRKIAATVGTLILGVGYYHFALRGSIAATPTTIIDGTSGAFVTDTFISCALLLEYASRKHERRARRVARKVGNESLLETNGKPVTARVPAWAILKSQVKQAFVPNFNL